VTRTHAQRPSKNYCNYCRGRYNAAFAEGVLQRRDGFERIVQEQKPMESTQYMTVDLFADELPSMDEIDTLAKYVRSSERNQIDFAEQIERNISRTGQQACLTTGIGLCILTRYDEAVNKLQKAAQCKEKFIYLARCLRRLGRLDEAIESLDKSLKHGAETLSVALEKTATCRDAGNFQEAEKLLKTCANFEKVSAEYHFQLGRLQEVQGMYEQAVENYKAAIELTPSHRQALFHLAYRCSLGGDEEAAIDYYRQIVSHAPAYTNALLNLAVLYEDTGEYEKAGQCVDKVLKFHPNHQRARLFKKDIESSKTMYYDEEKEKRKDQRTQILETPISDFELSVRSRNCFRKMGIRTLGDLLRISESELLSYKNFGETSLREIKVILEAKGLRLGSALEEQEGAETSADEAAIDETKVLLGKPVEDLNLSVRARKCLQKLNIQTLAELVRKTDAELLGCKNFGVTSLNEIRQALENLGLSLRTLE